MTPDAEHGGQLRGDRRCDHARGTFAAGSAAVPQCRLTSPQTGGAEQIVAPSTQYPRPAPGTDLHGIHVPARGDPGRVLELMDSQLEWKHEPRRCRPRAAGGRRRTPSKRVRAKAPQPSPSYWDYCFSARAYYPTVSHKPRAVDRGQARIFIERGSQVAGQARRYKPRRTPGTSRATAGRHERGTRAPA